MSLEFLYVMSVLRFAEILMKHKVSQVIFHDGNMFAVYYDEMKDRLRYLALRYTVVHEIDGKVVHRPILEDSERVQRDWIFLEVSGEIKPMSHYSDVILNELVKKVRRSQGGY